MSTTFTTPTGTTVTLTDPLPVLVTDQRAMKIHTEKARHVVLDHPDAPSDMRDLVAGRVIAAGDTSCFQPAPEAEFSMSPAVLRAIADLCEQAAAEAVDR